MSGTDQTSTAGAAAADTSGALSAAEALLALSPPRFTKQQQQDVTEKKKEEEEEPQHSSSSMSSSPPSLDNVGNKNQIIDAKNADSNSTPSNNEELTTQKMKNQHPSNGNSSMSLKKTIDDNDNNDVGNEMTVAAASKPPPPSPPTTIANVNQHVFSNDNDSNNNVGKMPPPPSSTTVDETTTTADESTMMTPSNNNMDVDNDEEEEKRGGGQSVEGEEQQQVDNNSVEKQPVVESTTVKEAEELSSVPSSLMTTTPLKGSTSDDATSNNIDNSTTAIHTSAAAAVAATTTPSTNTTTTTINPKSKVSEKSPRKENDWLRSETSIGDGYSNIVTELEKLHMVLLGGGSGVQKKKKKKTALSTLDNGGDEKTLPDAAAAEAEAASGTGTSVMKKLGMWINGTKSPTTTVDTNGGNDVQTASNEMEGGHHQQQQQQQEVEEEEEEVKQRLEVIKQHSKSLMTSQRSGFLGSNYDLPSLVSKELDLIKGQLDDYEEYWKKKNSDVDNEDEVKTKRKNDLDQARDTYESVKSFSVELASRLEHEIQKFTENRKVKITEGQRPSSLQQQPALSGNEGATTTTTLDGVTNGDDQPPSSTAAAASSVYATATVATDTSAQQQKKKRKRVGAKCLTKVRQSWEMANNIGTTTSSSSTAARSTRNTRNRVQFLSSNSGTGTATTTSLSNLRNRDTYDMSLAEIIANVPDKDDTEDVTNESSTMMKKAPHLSYEPINGVIPTMAPPMFDGQPAPPDYVAAFGRNKKRKRGGARDSTGSVASSIGGDTSEKPKSKRSRRDDSSATSSETEATLPSSSSSRKNNTATNLHIRVLPDITPKPKVAYVEGDTNPTRLCNPLLRLPQFPDGPDPPIEEIPQGGELWNLADLHYYDPDTYPISYLARLLGFDVPEKGNDVPFAENFDPMTVKLMKDGPDSDPWASIPNRGQFSESIRKRDEENCAENGKADDLKLSYCDPLWANIISSYRGFNEKDFKDAGKGFSDDLLPDCFNFAIERGIVSKEKGISFRFGTPEDEALLQPLADKCSWKSHQKHDLATSLRGQSSFCIVAQSAESGPIAFIQYSFCWYRVEEKISAASGAEKVSELVVFLDALVYDSGMSVATEGSIPPPISTDDLECVKTLLTSLALVHAARANIWYGMVDSPQPLVHFFTKYFRMSRIGRDVTDAIPLVFDLKKCHFRYSILLLEEDLKRKKESNEAKFVASASERMLVRLPTNSVEIARTNVSSASKDSRSKKAHIRLVQDEDQLQIYSVSAAATAQEEECLSVFDPNSIDANGPSQWNVLRLFPSSNKTSEASPTDGFLEELERKQKELVTLEASIESTARCLLTKAYEEASDFHRNGRAAKKQQDENVLEEYAAVQKRLYEADLAWQAQLDQDMDAVCDICFDGEVTPENQIIFCDTCNVAVHQGCYGIEKVPSGNYFCRACTHFDIDKEFLAAERRRGPRTKPTRPHINCELCPRRNGAFVLVQSPESTVEPNDKPKKAKWVHVSCAKWHGMNYVDIELKDKIEDVSVLKNWFKSSGHQCCLCESGVGAMHQCRQEGCGKWLHLTCGRSIGTCSVQHGENCFGFYDETKLKYPPWTLACPKHSDVDPESIREDSLSLEQLVTIAKSYPPEPVPPKPFYKMNGAERLEYWADGDNLKEFFAKVMSNLSGAKCIVCEIAHDPNDSNSANIFCPKCGVFSHAECADPNRGEDGICYSCRFVEDNNSSEGYQEPRCHMCNTSTLAGGPLMETRAQPLSMKKWKLNLKAFERSLFGPNQFCHTLCGLWNDKCISMTDKETGSLFIDCFNIIMSDGRRHVSHQFRCFLCGKFNGAKVHCFDAECKANGGTKKPHFHITCARQAGLHVTSDPDFSLACFQHADSSSVFRARLEDFMEVEIMRYTEKAQMKNMLRTNNPMSWDHASKLFHSAVDVLRTLGWAWRWAEWWVESGDNWEPLIRDDQNEAEMTDKELKKVESTSKSRCIDARRCRLAALGAALRNRDYDKIEGDDQEPLQRALMAVMSTPSLVGPLKQKEKEFYVTWLSLAYRSATPRLGFGDHKTPVASDSFCIHQADGSPKFELGSRPLPGKTAPEKENGVFEPLVDEPDDFLKTLTSGEKKKRQSQSA